MAVKAQDADRYASAPPKDARFVLIYGPDAGLVSERARSVLDALGDPADPFSVVRLDGAALSADPARLADEAYAVSMFGGRRVIALRDVGNRPTVVELIGALFKRPPPDAALVVEAGDLKKSSGLRALFERDRAALAIPCYADGAADVGRLVDAEVKAHGLRVTPAARAMLVGHLGGDRLLSRMELVKLCTYALSSGEIDVDDVRLMVVDSVEVGFDDLIDATAGGDLPALVVALGRAEREGIDPSQIATTVLRHFHQMDLWRMAVDGGTPPKDVVAGARPPVFFKRQDKVAAALSLWSATAISRAIARLAATARDARLSQGLGREILAETLIALARHAGPRGR